MDDLPEGEVTIRVAYSSVNFKYGTVGILNNFVTSYRYVPGIDLVGTVIDSKDNAFQQVMKSL